MPSPRLATLRVSLAVSLALLSTASALAAPARPREAGRTPRAAAATADAGATGPESARVETLAGPPADGIIRTPEGFIRLEGPPAPDDGVRGSFGTYRPRRAGASASEIAAATPAGAGDAGPQVATAVAAPAPPTDPCRTERNRYVRRLLQAAGIDLDDPLALAENLAGPYGSSPWVIFSGYGLLPGVDPLRPLAWDLELRSLARDLAACAR